MIQVCAKLHANPHSLHACPNAANRYTPTLSFRYMPTLEYRHRLSLKYMYYGFIPFWCFKQGNLRNKQKMTREGYVKGVKETSLSLQTDCGDYCDRSVYSINFHWLTIPTFLNKTKRKCRLHGWMVSHATQSSLISSKTGAHMYLTVYLFTLNPFRLDRHNFEL